MFNKSDSLDAGNVDEKTAERFDEQGEILGRREFYFVEVG
jgi:hypothetical protein